MPPLAHASHAAAQAVRSASAGGELRRKPPRRSRSAAHKEGAGRIGRQALTASHAEASAGELACAGSWRVASDSWAPPPPPLKSSGGGAHALASTMHSPGKGWGQGQGWGSVWTWQGVGLGLGLGLGSGLDLQPARSTPHRRCRSLRGEPRRARCSSARHARQSSPTSLCPRTPPRRLPRTAGRVQRRPSPSCAPAPQHAGPPFPAAVARLGGAPRRWQPPGHGNLLPG